MSYTEWSHRWLDASDNVQYGHESKWMAMIDVDEFLLAGDGQTKDIKEVLDHFESEKAMLYVQEMFFGHQVKQRIHTRVSERVQ